MSSLQGTSHVSALPYGSGFINLSPGITRGIFADIPMRIGRVWRIRSRSRSRTGYRAMRLETPHCPFRMCVRMSFSASLLQQGCCVGTGVTIWSSFPGENCCAFRRSSARLLANLLLTLNPPQARRDTNSKKHCDRKHLMRV